MAYVFAPFAPTGATGIAGMDGRQGDMGPTGPTGPTGYQGWGGWGNYGPAGSPNFNLSAVNSGTTITVTRASLGTTYYITANTITALSLPDMTSPTQITSGAFWMFQNNSTTALTIALNLTAGGSATATYNGNASATSVSIPVGGGFTLAYTGSSTAYIVF